MPDDASPTCDRCGRSIHPGRGDYYLVRIDAVADPAPPILTAEDLTRDISAEMERLLERMRDMTERELEDQVARRLVLWLCVPCYQYWIADPVSP